MASSLYGDAATKHTPSKKLHSRLLGNTSNLADLTLDVNEESSFNNNINNFSVPHPSWEWTGTLAGMIFNNQKLESQHLDAIKETLGKIAKETAGNGKPSEFLEVYNRSATTRILLLVMHAVIARVDSTNDDVSIEGKRCAIFVSIFNLLNLLAEFDTRPISTTIVRAMIDFLTYGCEELFCDDQAEVGENNRIGFLTHIRNETTANDIHNLFATQLYFIVATILIGYRATIGDDYKNKAVNLLVNLSGRVQNNAIIKFVAKGAKYQLENLVMINGVDSDFLTTYQVAVVHRLTGDINTRLLTEMAAATEVD